MKATFSVFFLTVALNTSYFRLAFIHDVKELYLVLPVVFMPKQALVLQLVLQSAKSWAICAAECEQSKVIFLGTYHCSLVQVWLRDLKIAPRQAHQYKLCPD